MERNITSSPFVNVKKVNKMSCTIVSGISKGCKKNMPGIKTVYLANKTSVSSVTVDSNEQITAITMASSVYFYEFEVNKNSSNWVENINAAPTNGTISYEQVLTVIFGKNEATKRNLVKILGQAEMVAIVVDKNDEYWYLGYENGLDLTGGTSSSGTTSGELNGWTLTITGNEPDPAKYIYNGATVVASVLEP